MHGKFDQSTAKEIAETERSPPGLFKTSNQWLLP